MFKQVKRAKAAKICWDMSDYWGIPLLMKFQQFNMAILVPFKPYWCCSGIFWHNFCMIMIVDGSWCCIPWSKRLRKPMLFLHIQQWSPPLSEMFSVNWFINFCRMGNLQETPMFLVKSCVIHCFRLRFSHLNQSIDQLGTVSISKSEFIFFKVTRAIPGLPWTQDWVNVLRGVDQFIWKHLKTKDFSRRQELWVWSIWQRLTAFDCVWHCFVIIV